MEVSSHALDQHRVHGTDFSAGIFTNLSQDHLDYHVTMEAYFESKARLFTGGQVAVAIVNRHGPWGARLAQLISSSGARLVTYAPEDAHDVAIGPRSSSFSWRGERFELNMAGRFNVLNALAAATAASELGIGPDAIATGLKSVAPVRGRFEAVDVGPAFHRADRLRPHAGGARRDVDGSAGTDRTERGARRGPGARAHRLWCRRGQGPDQAPSYGEGSM